MLLSEGYAELHTSFRKSDFEASPEEISFELADRLTSIQAAEQSARMAQRGPIWSQYSSEFTTYTNRMKITMKYE